MRNERRYIVRKPTKVACYVFLLQVVLFLSRGSVSAQIEPVGEEAYQATIQFYQYGKNIPLEAHIVREGQWKEEVENKYYGKYKGLVVDNNDPENLGRLRVKVPRILGEEVVSGWAMPCVPFGGAKDQGFFFIPEVGARVWVEFEEGDPQDPIWVGTFWTKPGGVAETPPQAQVSPPTNRVIKTPSGHMIEFNDKSGGQKIKITDKAGNSILLDSSNNKLIITQGKTSVNTIAMDRKGITIQDANLNKISMDASGVTIQDKSLNKIIMSSSGITIQDVVGAFGKVSISGSGVTLGVGIRGNIACVGTNMVATTLEPQPIIQGVNISNKA